MNRIHGIRRLVQTLVLGMVLGAGSRSGAAPVLPEWKPLFKGIQHLTATNVTSGGDFQNLMVAYALRIDLQDPDIRLLSSPRNANYLPNIRETAGRTVSQFVRTNKVQAAINAGFFSPTEYYLPEGTAMTVAGLLISQGEPVSPAVFSYASCLLVDASNNARIIHTNWPAVSTEGIWTAVSGDYPVLVGGVNISRAYLGRGGIHGIHPRTAIGLSQDRRFLFFLVIDGRQGGYSEGSYDYETAAWLLLLGAHDGINMDGGGSSTMVVEDSTGNPQRLNRPSSVADSGKERTVGGHLGVFAKPLPGFINDVSVLPDDDAATLTWTTVAPATSGAAYGPTESLGQILPEQPALKTAHAVRLTGLQPGTGYYFSIQSRADGTLHSSPVAFFTTISHLQTNGVIALTNAWKYSTANLDNVPWTTVGYNDSGWAGPGDGLLWVDTRSTGPNPDVSPRGAQMEIDSGTGFPYTTYYFRRHFQSTLAGPGASLLFSGFLDDGAVIHLNGQEIHRLRMAPAPAAIANDSLADSFPCIGDADCRDEFTVSGDALAGLVTGDNVLAIEVHNYSPRSPDITFGFDVIEARNVSVPAVLTIADEEGQVTLSWTRGGFILQWAESPTGPWTDVPGPVLTSPHVVGAGDGNRYYRLAK